MSSVQVAFENQSAICTAAGAPFTGRMCRLVGERLDDATPLGRRILNWAGNPSHEGDALPLRLMGGLHALARSGLRPDWSAVYPPAMAPDDDALWALLADVLQAQGDWLDPWLDGPPQTNEVGRSAGLMAGLMVLADRFGLPFSLYELGASAGLNSLLDHYGYRLGDVTAGEAGSAVQLSPRWTGDSPPKARVEVVARQAVDRNPLDATDARTREMLAAYVWADQRERLSRLEAALEIAGKHPVTIDRADAADWLEQHLSIAAEHGVCSVVMHTIAYQYFPPDAQQRIRDHLQAVGEGASANAPLAWLRFEASDDGGPERRPALDLTIWPGGETRRLAIGQPHGASYDWMG
ncbi:DUF2332 family protein [uncultured Brevundimonas sp.]|uniref:DUF2332 domain-containing protein n=1 Tax=uncultured Brevundimonas sp. TaxID=213418 RepID=UPI00262C2E6A|nr:DUF2332 family protein [uncultured Brevundimonas sp.]